MVTWRTPTRDHNHLLDCGSYFIKSSEDISKILAEKKFYECLPDSLKTFYPTYLGSTEKGHWPNGYSIQKINNYDASIYFTGLISTDLNTYFKEVFQKLSEFLSHVPKLSISFEEHLDQITSTIFSRDLERVKKYQELENISEIQSELGFSGFSDPASFADAIHSEIKHELRKLSMHELWFSHGDLCFSNIILNEGNLYFVDPRGITTLNDFQLSPLYDLAKISQCLYGGYDFINHELDFNLFRPNHYINKFFEDLVYDHKISMRLVSLVEACHFIAMIPLHKNHPQKTTQFIKCALQAFKRNDK